MRKRVKKAGKRRKKEESIYGGCSSGHLFLLLLLRLLWHSFFAPERLSAIYRRNAPEYTITGRFGLNLSVCSTGESKVAWERQQEDALDRVRVGGRGMASGGGHTPHPSDAPRCYLQRLAERTRAPFRSTAISGTWFAGSLRLFLLWTEFVDSRIQNSIDWILIIHHLVSACILVGWASGKCAVLRLEFAGYT